MTEKLDIAKRLILCVPVKNKETKTLRNKITEDIERLKNLVEKEEVKK